MPYRVVMTIEKDGEVIRANAIRGPDGAPMSMAMLDAIKLWAAETCFPNRLDDPHYLKTGQAFADL